jgi:threonine dehydratase
VITRDEVTAAAQRIAGWVRQTPLLPVDEKLSFKLEYLQHSGSFKARGAFNRLLSAPDLSAGVVSASGGNAALAVAYAASVLGVPVTVFVPETAPPVKVAKLKTLGAEVNQTGSEYAMAYDAAQKYVAETGALFCHAYDQPEVVAGAGTIALELPPTNVILVSVGGGGLMAGLAAAVSPAGSGGVRVIGVEPVGCAALHSALAAGEPVDVPVGGIAADSLGARRVGDIAFEVATRTGVESYLVGDAAIIQARKELWHRYRIVVEHGAAAAYAALPAYADAGHVTVILCGANTDLSTV